jgi:quinoprotein glucose dehydrogenase
VRFTFIFLAIACCCVSLVSANGWRFYGGDAHGTKYSRLDQINKRNVSTLQPAWVFDTGDFSDGSVHPSRSALGTTPLVVDGVMYVATSFHRLFALDAETGAILWQFDPKFDRSTRVTLLFSRGVSYWSDGHNKRILLGDQMGRLFSLDAMTGKPDAAFGAGGVLDLKKGVADKFPKTPYGLTSPVTVCRDTVLTGSWIGDGEPLGPAGNIRGFDVRTGALEWTFHTVPRSGVWERYVGRRFVERPDGRECVVDHERRREARARLRAADFACYGHLWRRQRRG